MSINKYSVSQIIRDFFQGLDRPPADNVYAPPFAIREEGDGKVSATVRYEVNHCGVKKHEVEVMVTLNNKNEVTEWYYL